MPNRILREGILTSPRVANLGWAEECFYRRLMSVVDDFGRYFADLGLLRAACYPRQLNKVSDSDVGKWLACVQKAALVRVYPAQDGESYLELLDFRQQVRAKASKYPGPLSTCVADAEQTLSTAQQTLANEHLDVSVSVSVSDNSSPPVGGGCAFDEFWEAYPRKVGKEAARKAFDKCKPDLTLLAEMLRAIETQSLKDQWRKDGGQFIPHPSTWLNEGRWQDGETTVEVAPSANKSLGDTQSYLAEQAEHAAKVEGQRLARIAAKQPQTGATA